MKCIFNIILIIRPNINQIFIEFLIKLINKLYNDDDSTIYVL